MKSNRIALLVILVLILALMAGCSSSSGGSNTPAATLISIAVTPQTQSLAFGMVQQFTATGVYSNNTTQDLTNSVTWISSTTNAATISSMQSDNGLAKAVAPGTTTITASSGNITSNAATLTVTPAKIVSLTVIPADSTISTGTTQQYTATGTYSDASTKDLTASVTWNSSATDVATINSTGLAAAIASATTGTTIITATTGNVSGSATLTVTGGSAALAANVMPITVNGALCSEINSAGYLNKPCVSVTVCTSGTATCETVSDILLDTGSYGLRIFKQAFSPNLASSLTAVKNGTGLLAECVQFTDGSAEWGPVRLADVVLGNEPAVQIPIQIIDATFGTVPTSCGTVDLNPSAARFNGILGVGVFDQDCGSFCVSIVGAHIYYSCNGTTCAETRVPLANQVWNPVALLPTDNNGVIVQLPSIAVNGVVSVNGILVLGIDTRSNNSSSGVTIYDTDQNGEIVTIFNNMTYSSIVDSGSNGLYFAPPTGGLFPDCGPINAGWFCPTSIIVLDAVNKGASGALSEEVVFQIGNFNSLTGGSNMVFSDIGGSQAGSSPFDWGLPFYFGRNIFVGIEQQSTCSRCTGPYFAY